MANLVTLSEVKTALGITGTERDALITQTLPEAYLAIQRYTNRTFGVVDAPAAERTFPATESGVVPIADAQHGSVSSVRIEPAGAAPYSLVAGSYTAYPLQEEYPVAWWLDLQRGRDPSPEMGFTRNEDVFWAEHPREVAATVVVTAVWGWPYVPADVKRAAYWTVSAFMEAPKPYVSESIDGYSRQRELNVTEAIPPRAATILDYHVRG